MKSTALLKAVYQDCLDRGYVQVGDSLYPPNHPAALKAKEVRSKRKPRTKHIKTGDIHDSRNVKNKEQRDTFVMLIEKSLGLEVWPEFFFTANRQWRFDYCIPEHKLYIEVEGGVWTGGRHTRGKGFVGDMEKYNRATSLGWKMIRVVPTDLHTESTIKLIKAALSLI